MIKISVYTDGSKFPKYTHIGLGAFCQYKGIDYKLSTNVEQEVFSIWSDCEDKVSNPTAELSAATEVLYEFSFCKKPVHLEIVADYIGVKKWPEKQWQAKKPYIKMLLKQISIFTQRIEQAGGKITYRHIRGHQKGDSPDVYGNNQSDNLAKSTEKINNFKHLIQLIND